MPHRKPITGYCCAVFTLNYPVVGIKTAVLVLMQNSSFGRLCENRTFLLSLLEKKNSA